MVSRPWKTGASYDFDDLVQSGLEGLIEAVDAYEPSRGVPFMNFAINFIRGRAQDFIRLNHLGSRRKGGPLEFVGLDEDRDAAEDHGEDRLYLYRALATLEDRRRLVLFLYYLENFATEQIASTLDVSETRVRQLKYSAFKHMRKILKEWDCD